MPALLFALGVMALAQQPRIDSMAPSQGPVAGGTIVVSGANFDGASVALDRTTVVPLSQSDFEIRLQMPPHDNGYVVVTIRNAAGVAYREFLYVPPRLDELPPGAITTVAGVGRYDHAFGKATEAMISANNGIMFDGAGNAYVVDNGANRVYLVHADGTIERFSGNGDAQSLGGDGEGVPALDVPIAFARNVALDGAGNVYLPDANFWIRQVTPNGIVHNVAGTGRRGFAAEGAVARGTAIGYPSWIAADKDDLFFIEDFARIRRIHFADGTISTFVPDGNFKLPSDDAGGLTLDTAGNVYVLDTGNGRIRKIDRKSGAVETLVTVRDAAGNTLNLTGFTVDRDGNLYYSPGGYIAKAAPGGTLLAQYGKSNAPFGFSEDGTPAAAASFGQINYLTIDPSGNLVFVDSSVGRARRINAVTGKIETIAGIRPPIYAENGPATAAILNVSNGGDLDFAPNGELLIADTSNERIRRLDVHGNLTTIAGNGMIDGPADGAAATATGGVPLAIHADAGGIDVVPFGRVVRIDAAGIVHSTTRFIGGGSICHYSGDGGLALDAGLCQPWDTARDRDGNLFVADTNNNRIRRIDAVTGVITTVAGNGAPPNGFERYGKGTECGDGGQAIDACFNTPYGLVFDRDGNLFVSDNFGIIRKIDTNGVVSTVARFPATKLRADAAGSIFGVGFDQVARFDRQGKLTVLGGANGFGFSGDGGPARAAKLQGFGQSQGVAIDREGNLFFVDAGNYRVRAIRDGAFLAPPGATIQAAASGTTIRATVFHPDGSPAPSVRVDFTAPAFSPTCALSSPFTVTDENGMAAVICAPGCAGGTYNVTAKPLTALSSASVTFTNVDRPCHGRAARH